ncbi:MAG: SDR family oxidoreductase [Burkholderiales bacterium]|nr:SDR family oxidoreductase [Burkholderiales bacterium]
MTRDAGFTLVTGATKGIGRAISDRLLARGERVVGIARRADPSYGAPLILADLADRGARAEALRRATAQYPVLRLVNNAGLNHMQPLGEVSHEAADEVLELNLGVTLDATQAVLPAMRAAGFGRIVNISSRSLLGRPGGSMYAAAKAGLVGLTRSWALELATQGITVNCVAPGPVATEMFARNNPPELPRSQAMLAAIPMARMGTVQEVAAAVEYFLSPEASFTTGQTLFVCGGASISQARF